MRGKIGLLPLLSEVLDAVDIPVAAAGGIGTRVPAERLGPLVADATTTGTIAEMSLWAGQSVGAVKQVQPAQEIVQKLVRDAETFLRRRP